MALGEVDYGLMGLVGGLSGFVSFFNSILASAIGRFYAIAVGRTQIPGEERNGLDECWKWFNTALLMHLVVPLVLLIIGYPIGEWAVRRFLTIPADRVGACIWVWRFVCLACFVSMITVPFSAMYNAKQYIAELTIYGFITTTINACILYYMVSNPDVWLTKFALLTCVLSVVPNSIIAARAVLYFRECKIKIAYLFDLGRVRKVCSFAGWQFFGVLGNMLRGQGIQLVVNKFFGPSINAGMAIGSQVNAHAITLAGAMQGAFGPAITNSYGAGDLNRMRILSFRVCKFGLALSLIFVLPLILEVSEVLKLWLKNPPAYSIEFCFCILIIALVDKTTVGHMMAVNAVGKIAMYQFVVGSVTIMAVPLAILCAFLWRNPLSVMVALFLVAVTAMFCRVFLARSRAGLSISTWLNKIMIPIFFVILVTVGIGCLPRILISPSFFRIILTTLICECVYVPLIWLYVLSKDERAYFLERIRRMLLRW